MELLHKSILFKLKMYVILYQIIIKVYYCFISID